MSVAAGHAVALRDALAVSADGGRGLDNCAEHYFANALQLTAQAWNTAAMGDLEFPETRGVRPKDFEKRLAFADALRRAARKHHEVHKLRFEIAHLLSPVSVARDGPLAALISAELQPNP